ncbi:metallophosphoesterase [Acidihalobacter prosperus]
MKADDQPLQYHVSLARNEHGRDFCVGDLHGAFNVLERALDDLGFDPERDRLISVGDLIDRGPQSPRVLEFLRRPWFHAVRGNHETMLLDNIDAEEINIRWLMQAGASWWLMLDDAERAAYPGPLSELPYAIEVDTADGRIGVVHADVPEGMHWDEFVAELPRNDRLREHALWARTRIGQIQRDVPTTLVEGIDLLVVGHTPVSPITFDLNVCFLDTGAAYAPNFPGAALTLLEIHPQRRVHTFPTG